MTGFDASEDRLLRAAVPPPMSPGFANRVMAALPKAELPRPARDRRGGWTRGRRALVGAVAAGLFSVGAAASGLLGGRVQQLPVIATIAEAVQATPVRPLKPAVKHVAATPRRHVAAPLTVAPAPDDRREEIAERIADHIEQREARRASLGLPPVDRRVRRAALARLQQLPPEERRALVERVREIRTERGVSVTPLLSPEHRAERRARWREIRKNLSPEQRERLREWRERRRAMRGEITPEPAE